MMDFWIDSLLEIFDYEPALRATALLLIVIFVMVTAFHGFKESYSNNGIGAVSASAKGCANVGGEILRKGGSAADAAIATLLCDGIMIPQSLGVGGGFVAVIYNKSTSTTESLIARETAPAAAHRDMFVNSDVTGALAAAVPAEIWGYWRLHQRYGRLPWRELFQPAIRLCANGYEVSTKLARMLASYESLILAEPSLKDVFINPFTNSVYKTGELMYRPVLAETLRIIGEQGAYAMYRGGIIQQLLVQDIQKRGGIITEQDMQNYEVRWENCIQMKFSNNYTLHTTPLPTSGVLLAFILNVMSAFTPKYWQSYVQRLIETYKHAFGRRTNLGDVYFEPQVNEVYQNLQCRECAAQVRKLLNDNCTYHNMSFYGAHFANCFDNGTASVAALAPNGDAIVITSTINSHFGCKIRSQSTGIILNDHMDDFSTPGLINKYGIPASPNNFIKPGKMPMSSSCPAIVLDKHKNVRLLIGGAGGARITTAVAQTILLYFMFNRTIEEAVNSARIHHQLAPMSVDVEPGIANEVLEYLVYCGHKIKKLDAEKAYSALNVIGLKTDVPIPLCDIRRPGSTIVIHTKF